MRHIWKSCFRFLCSCHPPMKASPQDQSPCIFRKITFKSVADSFTWLKAEKFKIFTVLEETWSHLDSRFNFLTSTRAIFHYFSFQKKLKKKKNREKPLNGLQHKRITARCNPVRVSHPQQIDGFQNLRWKTTYYSLLSPNFLRNHSFRIQHLD